MDEYKQSAWDDVIKHGDPDSMFDLAIAGAYFAGANDGQIPVEEARKVFDEIKRILAQPH